MSTPTTISTRPAWINIGLSASATALALALAALVQRHSDRGGSLPSFDSQALAAVTAQAGGYMMLTAGSNNEEIVLVLDNRREQLMVYRAENASFVQALQRVSLTQMFAEAKAKQQGLPLK